MLRDTACMIIKFQLNGSNKYLLKIFEKNRLSGTSPVYYTYYYKICNNKWTYDMNIVTIIL